MFDFSAKSHRAIVHWSATLSAFLKLKNIFLPNNESFRGLDKKDEITVVRQASFDFSHDFHFSVSGCGVPNQQFAYYCSARLVWIFPRS